MLLLILKQLSPGPGFEPESPALLTEPPIQNPGQRKYKGNGMRKNFRLAQEFIWVGLLVECRRVDLEIRVRILVQQEFLSLN